MTGVPLLGITLPSFTGDGTAPIRAARAAEDGGLDGVFVFDHLWPMGSPGRPALWSFAVLGAVMAATVRVCVAPLVARIGLLPEDEIVRMFGTLSAIGGPERVIAALGVGDRLSAQENVAYGLDYPVAAARLLALAPVLDELRRQGLAVWMGARSEASLTLAATHADVVNSWGAGPGDLRALTARGLRVTWGGQVLVGRSEGDVARLIERYGDRPGVVTGTVASVASHLRVLARAGAEWCVMAPLDYLDDPEGSTQTSCLVAEAVR